MPLALVLEASERRRCFGERLKEEDVACRSIAHVPRERTAGLLHCDYTVLAAGAVFSGAILSLRGTPHF